MSELIHIGLAIIVDTDRHKTVVGVRPGGVHLAGMYEFPGGKVEPGESVKDCALREALEETGLIVEVVETWPEIQSEYPERTVVLHPFLCVGDEIKKVNEPWSWVEIRTLDETKFPEANKGLIQRLLAI